ncbi:MAG TPA: hypothetical protein VN446_08590 [Candidatus Acidoferrum sp.]|nr:hypothetical protein [Candidatus Acidoferrum sp.]
MNSQSASIFNLDPTAVAACFAITMLSDRVTHIAAPCSLQVDLAGVYEVQYKLDLIPNFTGGPIFLNVFMQVNGVTFATEQHLLTTGIENNPHGLTYVSLAAGDMVSLALSASSAVTMDLLAGLNAYLTVQMIGS